ncbi:MAG: conjugative relaxase-related protein [Bacteroidota bacterium]|nr:conjugative relaxase-related protein [Bacteroidota bacterium]MDP4205855.1 conjugative relaxase-related protein [Bacteroidota bacterium]
MNDIFNLLLRVGLSYGLHDKEAFVEKFSEVLKDKMGDELQAEKVGQFILDQMQMLKDQLTAEQILSHSFSKGNKDLKDQIEELTKAVKELNENVKHQNKNS